MIGMSMVGEDLFVSVIVSAITLLSSVIFELKEEIKGSTGGSRESECIIDK
jgi:hypothetical protein